MTTYFKASLPTFFKPLPTKLKKKKLRDIGIMLRLFTDSERTDKMYATVRERSGDWNPYDTEDGVRFVTDEEAARSDSA